MHIKLHIILYSDCDKENVEQPVEAQSLADDVSIPSPDFSYFGSQEMTEGPSFLDSILEQSPCKPEEERKLVQFLSTLTSSND